MPNKYSVTWTLEVVADSPEEAAQKAEEYMLNTNCRHYEVTEFPAGEDLGTVDQDLPALLREQAGV